MKLTPLSNLDSAKTLERLLDGRITRKKIRKLLLSAPFPQEVVNKLHALEESPDRVYLKLYIDLLRNGEFDF